MRTTLAERIRKNKITSIITSVAAFFLVLLLCCMLFSAVINALELNSAARSVLASLSVCAGCFAGAYTLAKRRRKGGYLLGLGVGAAVFIITFIGTLLVGGAFTAGGFFSKLTIIIVCSVLGGITGVNKKV